MADEVDIANDNIEREKAMWNATLHYDIPQGTAGVCNRCEEDSPRLIKGVCAPCRDKYKLK